MAKSLTCTKNNYKHYNGGWSSWTTTFYNGYAGSDKYAVLMKITTPAFKGQSISLKIQVPWVRQASTATSGKLYFYIMSGDYTGTPSNLATSSLVLYSGSVNWTATDQSVHTTACTIATKTLKPSTVYYIGVRCSTNFLEIGYSSAHLSKFIFTLNYNNNIFNICTNTSSNTWVAYLPYICTNITSNTWAQYISYICTNVSSNTWTQYGGSA